MKDGKPGVMSKQALLDIVLTEAKLALYPRIFKPRYTQPVFHGIQNPGGDGYQDEVDNPRDKKDLRVFKKHRGQNFCFPGKLDAGHHIGQGRIFYQIDELVAAAGEGPSDGLGQNYGENRLHLAEAERLGAEHLSLFN